MATINGCDEELRVRVVSRRLVKASDSSIKPHVLAVSNADLLVQYAQPSALCIYPNKKPPGASFEAVVAVLEARLPAFLDHFFPFAGRMATNATSGVPEVRCGNQGAELVVGEAGVPLASLDYTTAGASLRKILLPRGDPGLALSVQVVSFACGGFAVAWRTSHVLVDGSALFFLVSAWSELARSGTLAAGSLPSHDRSVFRPRSAPSYGDALGREALTVLGARSQINALTAQESFVERLYCIAASDIAALQQAASRRAAPTRVQAVSAYLWKALAGVVAGTAETRCRMAWRVNVRRRLAAAPELRGNYVGNAVTLAVREAGVEEVLRMPLQDVAAMVREAVAAPSYGEHFQELLDWVEAHRAERFAETASVGLGSPTLRVTAATSFRLDTDWGFGHAAMVMPVVTLAARLCSGYLQLIPLPGGGGDDGAWIASALVWPRLATALESANPCIFKPLTAEHLGLVVDPHVQRSRL
ncbi:unnamed protein product [Urochloa humidicola]